MLISPIFDQKYAMERYCEEMYAIGYAEGYAEGYAIGYVEGLKEAALRMKGNGFSEAAIANAISIDLQTIHQWVTEPSEDVEDLLYTKYRSLALLIDFEKVSRLEAGSCKTD